MHSMTDETQIRLTIACFSNSSFFKPHKTPTDTNKLEPISFHIASPKIKTFGKQDIMSWLTCWMFASRSLPPAQELHKLSKYKITHDIPT